MNIIHIGNIAQQANGVGHVVLNLSRCQRMLGHNVIALTARKKSEEMRDLTEVHKLSDLERVIKANDPDIIVFHSIYIWEYIKFSKYLIRNKIPYLIQLHGGLSKENYKKNHLKKWIANKLFYYKFLKNAKAIIYLNKGEYNNSMVKNINPVSIFIPNGINPPSPKPKLSSESDKVKFLFLGRFDLYHKALDILVEAIKILRDKGETKDMELNFYGTGSPKEIAQFEKLVDGLESIINLHGPVYGKEKDNVYRNSNIFILTSRSEGMPIGILEAMSYGLPSIVTPATNMGDIIEKNSCGWVTNLNANDIAKTILIARDDYKKNRTVLFETTQNLAKSFTWRNIALESFKQYNVINRNA